MSKPFKEKYHLEGGELIRQVTFGMNDGIVSIFALLAGVVGAGQSPKVILIALLAASIAGALSMAAGEFISGKGEHEFFAHEIENERLELTLTPEIELEELRIIYRKKGFSGEILEKIVSTLSKDPELWVREMVIEELGVTELEQAPGLKTSGIIFIAFIFGSLFPVLPYVFLFATPVNPMLIFWIATGVTFGGLFLAGALKTFVTGINWLKSGVEMLIVGSFAFGISYLVGMLFNI
ncbi:MAG: VIT1/CCC1 transporter family protein [Promethearchaeota archaeon]